MKSKKRAFLGVNGLPVETMLVLRQRARQNNRSVSGEVRAILEGALKDFPQGNTEQETNQ